MAVLHESCDTHLTSNEMSHHFFIFIRTTSLGFFGFEQDWRRTALRYIETAAEIRVAMKTTQKKGKERDESLNEGLKGEIVNEGRLEEARSYVEDEDEIFFKVFYSC